MSRCRLLTWNLLAMRGFAAGEDPERHPGPARPWLPGAVASALRASGAEIIAIQEAPERAALEALATELGFALAWFPARWGGNATWRGGFPGAILSRHPISAAVDAIPALGPLDQVLFQRHWGWCEVHHPEGSLIVHTLHLCADWGGVDRTATRLAEIGHLRTAVEAQRAAGMRVIVCGDCNSPAGNPARQALDALGGSAAMTLIGRPPTAPTIGAVVSIDEVWAFAPVRVSACTLLDRPPYAADLATGVALSDHLPVLAELDW